MVTSITQQATAKLNHAVASFIADAGTDKGFSRRVGGLRFIALLFLTVRFRLDPSITMPQAVPFILWGYFIVIVIFHFQADFRPDQFDARPSRIVQILLDLGFVTLFYVAAGDLKSDVFQLYILPLLVVARYTRRLRALFGFLLAVFLCTAVVFWTFYQTGLGDSSYPEIWGLWLASRIGFLALLSIIYTVYQRRRRLSDNLVSAQEELVETYQRLQHGVFSVDRRLRITGMNEFWQRRYDNALIGQPYFQAFCPNARQPADCPLTRAMNEKRAITDVRLMFSEPVQGAYPVKLSVTPILSKKKNVIGASVVVLDMQARDAFADQLRSYAAGAEFVADEISLEQQSLTADYRRQFKAITESTAAVLSPDQPLGVKRILQRMAELLRCQMSDLRLWDVENGRSGLILSHIYGYDPAEAEAWWFLEVESASIVARAFREKRPTQAYDVQTEPNVMKFIQKAKQYGLHSVAAFPLLARGDLIGAVSMYRNRREVFSDDELQLGQTFANALAAAMHNQQLIDQTVAQSRLQADQVNALSELSQRLAVQKDVSTLARLITDFTRKHLQTEVSSLFLLQNDMLYRKAISGADETWFPEETYSAGQGLTGSVIVTGEAVRDNNVEESSTVVPEHLQRYMQALSSGRVKHLMAIPLIGQEGLIGVLRIVNKLDAAGQLDPAGFTDYDLDLLTIISYSVAVAIQGAHLAEEQDFLLDLAGIASFSLFSDDLLSRGLKKITTLLEAEAGVVALPDAAGQGMVFTYTEGALAEKLRHTGVPISHSIMGDVFQTGKPALIADVNDDSRFYQALESRADVAIKSLVAVPVVAWEEKIGVLALFNKRIGSFTQRDKELLGSLASWMAIAKKNHNLFSQQRKRATTLLRLNNRAAEFTTTTTYKETLNKIAQGIKDLLGCDMAGVGVYDHRTKEIRALPDCGTVGVAPELIPHLRFGLNLSGGEVLRSRKIFKTADVKTDPHSIFGQELPQLVGARAIIAAPLYVGEREVGILYAGQRQPRHYSEEEERLVEAYARQAAIAIRNTELLNELERRVKTLDYLRSALGASEDDNLRQVLRIIAEAANDLLNSDSAFIAPFSINEDKLDIDLSVTAGGDETFEHSPKIRETGLTKKALDDPEGIVIIEDFAGYPLDFAGDFVRVHGILACATVRLEFRKDIVGILYVNYNQNHHFSDENMETLKLFATQAAMIIHNFNLMRRNEDIARERERERLREDMHSVLGGFHSRIMFVVERIRQQLEVKEDQTTIAALDRLWRSSSSIYRQMERILQDMRDPTLAERGLKMALGDLIASYEDELEIVLEFDGDCQLSPDVELALYRITHECIHNIIKHAALAENSNEPVLVQLDMSSPVPRLIIQDWGKGFDVWQARNASDGLGLTLIDNWARRIQARCDIQSQPGQGTIISVNVLQKEAIISQ